MPDNYILIGVGGTGAKVLESFVHLAASGAFGNHFKGKTVHLRTVDMDTGNGNLDRLEKLLASYSGMVADGKSPPVYDIFKRYQSAFPKESHDNPKKDRAWHPINIQYKVEGVSDFSWSAGLPDTNPNLSNLFQVTGGNVDDRQLLDALFSNADKALNLKHGCSGVPRVGSIIWKRAFEEDLEKPVGSFWKGLFNQLPPIDGDGTKILLVGSIFGGVGASGIPTIFRKLYEWKFKDLTIATNNNSLGLMMMLPYFSFAPSEGEKGAEPDEFILNSKLALRYYKSADLFTEAMIQKVYMVGDDVRGMRTLNGKPVDTNLSGTNQRNPAMPAELVAALSAMDFFVNAHPAKEQHLNKEKQLVVAKKHDKPKDNWQNLPFENEAKAALTGLTLFSLVHEDIFAQFCGDFRNMLDDDRFNQLSNVRLEWEEHDNLISAFCRRFLEWMKELEINELSLLDIDGCKEFLNDELFSLDGSYRYKPIFKNDKSSSLDQLIKIMRKHKKADDHLLRNLVLSLMNACNQRN
ncbi:MAG: hypothetical protein FWC73_06525 [Defluviitaleaceae bacterium]|nr:hypothetical protein [Defluviitaleaceae bacterium]